MSSAEKIKETYKKLKTELKNRNYEFTKEEFNTEIGTLLSKSFEDETLKKYSPKEYLINEKMLNSREFKKKVLELLEQEDQSSKVK